MAVWPTVAPWLEKALAASPDYFDTILDVYANLQTPEYHLWVADDAAVVSRYVPTPDGSKLHIWLTGGKMAGVKAIAPLAESFAHQLGCKSMTAQGRVGWQRSFLTRSGWKVSQVELRKRL